MTWGRALRRAGRRTNAALFVLCLGAFLSGWVAFLADGPVTATLTTVAHGLFGLGVVAVAPWKAMIATRAKRIPLPARALIGLTLVCLAAGFGQLLLGYHTVAPLGLLELSPMQVHVGTALVAVPLFAGHVRRRRPQQLKRADLSRRKLLRTGAFTLSAGVGYLVLLGVADWTRGPAGRVATGSSRIAAADMPATIWLLDRVPSLGPDHRVRVGERTGTAAELDAAGRDVAARLDCTSGWYADATWTGVPLAELIPAADLADARSIEVRSITGYTRHFPVADAGSLWLATRCEGRPLTAGGGAPVRLVAPGHRGFWWVKWVASVRLSAQPAALQSPFPLQ